MANFAQLFSSGLALGAIYALVALGFVIIYRASQVFNFAHGEILMFGAFVMATLLDAEVPWLLAVVIAMLATGLLAATLERVVLRPLVGRPVHVTIILTIVLGYVVRTAVIIIWGTHARGMPTPWDTTAAVEFGGAGLLYNSLAAIFAAAVALAVYYGLIKHSRFGLGMRASSVDQEAALSLGMPVGRILALTWFLAGMFAALAGIFLSMFPRTVDTNLGFVALSAFPAVIVGGLDSVVGTVIAGLLLGVLEVLTQAYVSPHLGTFGQGFHLVLPYVVMVVVLIVRPNGLFGRAGVERV